jgi:hypothetical protein
MLRRCRTTTKTIELFDRLRESERAPAKSGAFFLGYTFFLKWRFEKSFGGCFENWRARQDKSMVGQMGSGFFPVTFDPLLC